MSEVETVYLAPGRCFFGEHHHRVRTLLGSCVAVTMWHPGRRLGGMTHIMLPKKGAGDGLSELPCGEASCAGSDCRYADTAIDHMLRWLKRKGLSPREVQVKLFGGGETLAQEEPVFAVGERNIAAVQCLMERHGFAVKVADLGGVGHRVLMFDLSTGSVWVKRVERKLGEA